jgi:hypothetical protein
MPSHRRCTDNAYAKVYLIGRQSCNNVRKHNEGIIKSIKTTKAAYRQRQDCKQNTYLKFLYLTTQNNNRCFATTKTSSHNFKTTTTIKKN